MGANKNPVLAAIVALRLGEIDEDQYRARMRELRSKMSEAEFTQTKFAAAAADCR